MTTTEDEEMALSILHTADWHLGRRFRTFPDEAERRLTRARLEVISRILDIAQSRNVDAVLCAGDLFDSAEPDNEWWQGLLNEFKRRNWQRPVLLLPGNHDPLTPGSIYDHTHPFRSGLPEYVHIVDRDGFEFPIGDNAVIIGNPCRSHAGQTDLASSLPSRESGDDRIRIGLIHGQTIDIEGHQTNFPIARGIAAERGLDYLAIGDTHAFREVEPAAPVPTVYPSAPEATNFGEKDTGYVAIVFFPKDRKRRALIERERVGVWHWRDETCRTLAELRLLRDDERLRKTVLRLRLEMTLPLAEFDEAGKILTEMQGSLSANPKVGVLVADRSHLHLSVDDMSDFEQDLPPVFQAVIHRLQAESDTRPEVAERALHHFYQLMKEAH